ncbi:MAG: acetate--CoA ligase family protein [Spirochaetes bacterium]|nr:acetate--CoA ligase family protein [Spirochaetota bacterium]
MKLHEYQAKAAFAAEGIPVPNGILAVTVDETVAAADGIGYPCVLKSQILRGGRGKAGLVVPVRGADTARREAARLFASEQGVRKILVEEAVAIDRELYLAITVDAVEACALVLACADGGVEIEELARTAPRKIIRERVDLDSGLLPFQARNVAWSLGLEGETAKAFAEVLEKLMRVFRANDAELAEINPLFVTKDGKVLAGDGKLSIDDNAMFRHPSLEPGRDYYDSDIAFEAAKEGIPYLQFGGDISLMCAGAGLATTVYDLVNYEGGSVANYLEFGGPNYRKAVRAMELCLGNDPKVVLIVTFGTIARADVMAEGVAEAVASLKPRCPVVVCIRGTGEEKAVGILRAAGLEPLFDTEEAVRKAVALAKGGRP